MVFRVQVLFSVLLFCSLVGCDSPIGTEEAATSGMPAESDAPVVSDGSASTAEDAFDYSGLAAKSKAGCLLTAEEIEAALSLPAGSVASKKGKYTCEYTWTASETLPSWVSIRVFGEKFDYEDSTKSLREGAEMGIRYSKNLAEQDDYFMSLDDAGKILIFAKKGDVSLDVNFRGGIGTKSNFKQATDQDITDRQEEATKIGRLLMRKHRS